MSILSAVKYIGRATVVAAALGAVSLTALPANAAPPSQLQLNMKAKPQSGQALKQFNGQQKSYGFGDGGGLYFCLSDWEVKSELEDYGFDHVRIIGHYSFYRIKVKAYYEDDDTWYSMRVNKCTGEVDHIRELW